MNFLDIISKFSFLIIGIIQIIILLAIKVNDIKHIEERIKDLSRQLELINNTLKEHERRLAYLEGKLNHD